MSPEARLISKAMAAIAHVDSESSWQPFPRLYCLLTRRQHLLHFVSRINSGSRKVRRGGTICRRRNRIGSRPISGKVLAQVLRLTGYRELTVMSTRPRTSPTPKV